MRTGSPSCTRYELCVAGSPRGTLFPPRQRIAFHERVLEEILQERVAPRRGCRNPRGVKRKMSKFPLRPRGAPPLPPMQVSVVVTVVK